MKYLMILILLIPFGLKGQDTIPPIDTTPIIEVGEVYEFVVVVDSVVVDSVLTITKRMEKRKIISDQEYNNLLRYYNRKIEEAYRRAASLVLDLELAEDAMKAAGENKSLAGAIQVEIDEANATIEVHEAALAELEAGDAERSAKYKEAKEKKLKKKKEK